MTITSTTVKDIVTGDGGTLFHNTSFKAYSAEDVVVYERVIATNVYTLLNSSHYTATFGITDTSPRTVSITSLVVVPDTKEWIIYRASSFKQDVTFQPGGRLDSASLDELADRPTMLAQELEFYRKRSLHVSATDVTDATVPETGLMEIPSKQDRANMVLSFNADGEPTATSPTTFLPSEITVGATGIELLPLATDQQYRDALDVVNDAGAFATVKAGLKAAKGAANAHGAGTDPATDTGFYYETDTKDLYYSDGSTWVLVGNQLAVNNPPAIATHPADALKQLRVAEGSAAYELFTPTEQVPDITGSGDAKKVVQVNDDGNAYEFAESPLQSLVAAASTPKWVDGGVNHLQKGVVTWPSGVKLQFDTYKSGNTDGSGTIALLSPYATTHFFALAVTVGDDPGSSNRSHFVSVWPCDATTEKVLTHLSFHYRFGDADSAEALFQWVSMGI